MRTKNRYTVLAGGMAVQLCAGIIYGWSVFKGPVAAYLNWAAPSASLTSSVMLAAFVLGIILGGRAQDRLGPRKVTLAGGVLIGAGMACTSFVGRGAPWLVYVTYGVAAGLGVGAVYTSTIAASQKWFPDRRGFASGMTVCAFGFSLVVFAPLAKSMLAGLGVPSTFLIFGAGFFAVCASCSLFIQNPPEGFRPAGGAFSRAAGAGRQYSPAEIIRTRQFYLLAGAVFFSLPAYFILNPVFMSLGTERGLSEGAALIGVTVTGISSAAGRLAVSWISDRTGRKAAMISVAVLILCAALVMTAARGALFLICIVLVSFGFGGSASVYAAMTAESFGTRYGGENYGLVMIGFGASALVFQLISNKLAAGGSYAASFILAAATCAAAIVLVCMMKNPGREKRRGETT